MTRTKIPHIKVDAFPLVDAHFSGVGHYTLGIVNALDELAGEGKLTYSLIVPRKMAHKIAPYGFMHHKRIIKNPVPNRVIRGFMKYRIPFPMDLVLGIGNYYFPSFLAWPTWFSKSTVVIHDVTYLAVPECVEEGNRNYLERVIPFSLRNAKNVIAVSEFSKSEIQKYYKDIKHERPIAVAHPSVDKKHFYRRSADEIFKVRMKYDIYDNNYILAVGNVEPRKNYAALIDAYTNLPREITNKYPLVIVGAGGWNNDNILKKIQSAKENGYKIINPGRFVRDEDMPALFSGAHFFVFVPIYEGFGMSPIEAYACGTPVIASNVASVPEAAGKAAIYVDPFDTADITKKMKNLFRDLDKDDDTYTQAMRNHLKTLNWRQSGEITAATATGHSRKEFRR